MAGVALRFDGLGRRPPWLDEAVTMIRLEGRREKEIGVWYDGRLVRAADFRAPLSRSPVAVARGVAAEDPQTGLAYFLAAWVWLRALGDDHLATLRALSAVASTVTVLLVHRLARMLFGAADVALAAAALVALSPLQLRYAQEARPYALWAATLTAAAVALVRARDRGTGTAAVAYGLLLGAALWVHPLMLLALPAFAALGLGADPRVSSRATARVRVATAAAIASWSLWAAVCWRARTTVGAMTDWTAAPTDLATLAHKWLMIVTAVFYRPTADGGLVPAGAPEVVATIVSRACGILAVVFVALALWAVGAHTDRRTGRFVRLLTLGPWAVLATVDLVWGGRRSGVERYVTPMWIGAALAVAAFVAVPAAPRRRSALLAVVLMLAAATAVGMRSADLWWNTNAPRMRTIAAAARAIADGDRAVVMTDVMIPEVAQLARRLPDDTPIRLGARAPSAITDWDGVVLFDPSDDLRAAALAAVGPTRTLTRDAALPLWRVLAAAPRS